MSRISRKRLGMGGVPSYYRRDRAGIVAAISEMLRHLLPADRDRFLWKNAKEFYRL